MCKFLFLEAKSTARETLELLYLQNFRNFLFVRFFLIFAVYAQHTVISYHLFQLTHDPLSLGLLGLAEVIPAFLFSLPAGYLADKYNKRKMYLACVVVYVLISIAFFVITLPHVRSSFALTHYAMLIYTLVFFSGVARSSLAPASFSLLPLLIDRSKYARAISWSTGAWYLGSVSGPLLGAALLAKFGISVVLQVVICFNVLSFLLMYAIKIEKQQQYKQLSGSILENLKVGLKFVFQTKIILGVMCLDLFAVLFGGAEALLPAFSDQILKVGEVGYGWLRSAHGLGSILLTFILAFIPLKKNAGKKMLLSVLGFGLCIIVFGLSRNVYLSFACLFIAGMFDNVSVVIRHSILQLKTPEELKGRVSSVNTIFISSSNELGAFESGLAAKLMGTTPSVVFGGMMTALVVLIVYWFVPSIRKLEFD